MLTRVLVIRFLFSFELYLFVCSPLSHPTLILIQVCSDAVALKQVWNSNYFDSSTILSSAKQC